MTDHNSKNEDFNCDSWHEQLMAISAAEATQSRKDMAALHARIALQIACDIGASFDDSSTPILDIRQGYLFDDGMARSYRSAWKLLRFPLLRELFFQLCIHPCVVAQAARLLDSLHIDDALVEAYAAFILRMVQCETFHHAQLLSNTRAWVSTIAEQRSCGIDPIAAQKTDDSDSGSSEAASTDADSPSPSAHSNEAAAMGAPSHKDSRRDASSHQSRKRGKNSSKGGAVRGTKGAQNPSRRGHSSSAGPLMDPAPDSESSPPGRNAASASEPGVSSIKYSS